jgi:hypothetical protein
MACPTAMMNSAALVMIVIEASGPCWDAGKDFGQYSRGACDGKDS